MHYFKIIFSGIVLSTLGFSSYASLAPDGVTVSVMAWDEGDWEDGAWSGDRQGLRLATRWDWEKIWFEQRSVQLRGYWEASIAYWRVEEYLQYDADSMWAYAFSPVFQIMPKPWEDCWWLPFLEFGIGLAILSDDQLGRRELGSWWQFEDRLGAGFKLGEEQQFEISYRFMHYSNAGLEPPNLGLDWNTLNVSWIWG